MRKVQDSYEVHQAVDGNACVRQCQVILVSNATGSLVALQIHTECPWLVSRPVFVLIQQQPMIDTPMTYSLRTKVSWTAAESELTKVTSLQCVQ